MRVSSLFIFLAGVFLNIYYPLSAQTAEQYRSKPTYDRNSFELIKKLKAHLADEFDDEKTSETIRKINHTRQRYLKGLVEHEMFILDESLETYVNDIVNRLVEANNLDQRQRTVLVMRTHHVNAINYGKGVFFVTLGMLGRVKTEDELALALAHELAHDELDHIRQNIRRRAEAEKKDHVSESLSRVLTGQSEDENTIETLRQAIAETSQFSKKAEFEADSLGTRFFTRAGYDPIAGEPLFGILKNPTGLKNNIGIEFLLPLHSEAYPLQDEWFIGKISEYNKPTAMLFGMSLDSLQSHPELELRHKKFKRYGYEYPAGAYYQSEIAFKDVNREAELELIEMCYKERMHIRSMFFALQSLHDDPTNAHLVSRIAKMFLDLRTWKEGGVLHGLVEDENSRHSDELKLLSNLVRNINKHEASELAYHFISDKRRFNPKEPSHYYLRWKLCLATSRADEANEIKNRYKEQFRSSIDGYKYQ
jgi:hypothetical protein